MSQSQDMAAINDLFVRTVTSNTAANALRTTWIAWFNSLNPIERDYDSDILSDARLRRDAFNRAISTGAVIAPAPVPAVVTTTAKPTIKKGSSDPKGSTEGPVHEWQAIVGATPVDGIFGSQTESLTKKWQTAHGLVSDGIVGPLTWSQAIANFKAAGITPTSVDAAAAIAAAVLQAATPAPTSSQAAVNTTADRASTAVTTAQTSAPSVVNAATNAAIDAAAKVASATVSTSGVSSTAFPVLRKGSTGDAVKTWQGIIGVTADGIFGSDTEARTKTWQATHGLTADGIVGPATWTAAAIPTAGNEDVVANSFSTAALTVKGAFSDLNRLTPTWLKVTGGLLAGWSLLLGIASRKKTA